MATAPILFITFNRPDLAERVFQKIRTMKPSKLYFASDGPRFDNPDDIEKISKLRNIVINGIDWQCELKTLLREVNEGLPFANISAISWFFSNEEAGIILEDDTLPSDSFFYFCTELLERYKDDERIMQICGYNIFDKINDNRHSYFFSNFGHIWGWASWRRAWKSLDYELTHWTYLRQKKMPKHHPLTIMGPAIESVWNGTSRSGLMRWYYSIAINSGLFIIPSRSLIKNIGFRDDGTNFKNDNRSYGSINNNQMDFPLNHPEIVLINSEYELLRIEEKLANSKVSCMKNFKNLIYCLIKRFLFLVK